MSYIQKHVEVLSTLAQAIRKVDNFNDLIAVALTQACIVTDCNYGEAWVLSPDNAFLELALPWYKNEYQNYASLFAIEQFRLCSEGFIFLPGTGLPGRVWSTQRWEWIEDFSTESESSFLRNQIAKAFGVRAGFGIPVINAQQVLAVLVFLTLEACQEDRQKVEIALAIAEAVAPALVSFTHPERD